MAAKDVKFDTDARNRMLTGVNVEATERLAEAIRIPVIASGGVNNLEDIRSVC